MNEQQYVQDAKAIVETTNRQAQAAWARFKTELNRIGENGANSLRAAGAKNKLRINARYTVEMRGMAPEFIEPVAVRLHDGNWATP